jgi:hypothetical protein
MGVNTIIRQIADAANKAIQRFIERDLQINARHIVAQPDDVFLLIVVVFHRVDTGVAEDGGNNLAQQPVLEAVRLFALAGADKAQNIVYIGKARYLRSVIHAKAVRFDMPTVTLNSASRVGDTQRLRHVVDTEQNVALRHQCAEGAEVLMVIQTEYFFHC